MRHFSGKKSNRTIHLFVFVVAVISLHACGFQLRGSINLSDDISPIFIEQNSVFDLAREIKSLMASNNIKVAENVSQSKSQLTLLNEEKSQRVLSVDGLGRVREYLISYRVNFVINTEPLTTTAVDESAAKGAHDSSAHDSISHDSISVSRNLLFDPDAVLAVTNQAKILYEEMRRDAARLILLKLQARVNASHESASGGKATLVSDPGLDSTKTK